MQFKMVENMVTNAVEGIENKEVVEGPQYLTNIVAHWPIAQTSGSTIASAVNPTALANINGTFMVSATWDATGGPSGGACATFGGTNWLSWGDIFYYPAFTIFGRFYSTDVSVFKMLAHKRNSAGLPDTNVDEWTVGVSGQKLNGGTWNEAGTLITNFTGTTTISINQWYSFCLTVAGANSPTILYLNGIQEATATPTTDMRNSNSGFQIASRSGNNSARFFAGRQTDYWLYSRALSPTEVLALHNGQVLDQ